MRSSKAIATIFTLLALSLACVAAPAASASQTQIDFFEAPQQLLYTSTRGPAIQQLEALGVHALRIQLIWGEVAPHPNSRTKPNVNLAQASSYNWGQYFYLIQQAQELNWKVLLTVTGNAPCWASACATAHIKHESSSRKLQELVTNPNPVYYGKFMQAVGREFGGYVKLYSVWNEPNQPQMLMPQYVGNQVRSASIYRKLFLDGYAGLKASGNFSGMKVLMGETSPYGNRYADIVAPLTFMRDALCLSSSYQKSRSCGRLPAAGYAQHPYDEQQGPYWVPAAYDGGANDVTMATLGQLATALNKAAAAGAVAANLPIYVTEYGVQSTPSSLGVPVAKQAEYDAIAEQIAWSDPRVVSFDQYLLTDEPDPGDGSFQTGLEYVNGRPKPIYNGYRLPLAVTVQGGSHVAFWGLVRPATASTTVVLQYSSNGGGTWQQLLTAQTDANGYWTASGNFVANRLWRVQWTSAAGTVYDGAPTRAYVPGSSKPAS
ncbi:MAG: hypothetical protein ABSC56_05215 [Solirubrobacteraceae bacterium]|jgi:hypothetical protein